ncbi:hypothetical protein DFJ77DRAFT_168667 [Powellomyces hirtus]|nr:hypothetical protein DFJ77DRAFT_168667 [Powellomyces hirtus]
MTFAPSTDFFNLASCASHSVHGDSFSASNFFDCIDYPDSSPHQNGLYYHPTTLQASGRLGDSGLKAELNNDQAFLGYQPTITVPPNSIYPTPAESPLDFFETPPTDSCSDFDKIFADLLAFDTTPAQTFSPEDSLNSVFGDLPLYDHADSLFPSVAQDALFPSLDNDASAQTRSTNSVTLSFEQLSALLQAAAESRLSSSPSLESLSQFETASPPPTSRSTSARLSKDAAARRRAPKYICPHPGCGKHFTRHFNLKSHLPLHDPQRPRPFGCTECPKSFFKQNDLARHTATTHGSENQCECSCGKRYSRIDALKRHLKSSGCPNPASP